MKRGAKIRSSFIFACYNLGWNVGLEPTITESLIGGEVLIHYERSILPDNLCALTH